MTAIGIDLGGTNIKGVLLNAEGEVIHRAAAPTQESLATEDASQHGTGGNNGALWKETIAGLVAELKAAGPAPVGAVGLAAPGLANDDNSAIRVMPGRLQGLENFIWSDFLGEKNTWVLNDAHAALMAEARFGTGRGNGNIVMITLGTGVGGGILIDGKLHSGCFQMAGHLGHMTLDTNSDDAGITGMPGTLENAIGDATVLKRSLGRFASTTELVEAYVQGDTLATYVWLNAVRHLALGIRSLCNLLSPDLVILGGGITRAGENLFRVLADFMEVYEWKNAGTRIPVKQAHYGDIAGAVGAAAFALGKAK